MFQSRPPRPTMVTVLGWIWIGLGVFATFTSVMVVVMSIGMGDMSLHTPPEEAGFPSIPGMALVEWGFRHFGVLAAGQLLLSVLVLVAGIELLRLRRWARFFLEAICWLGLAYMVGFGALWASTWVSMVGQVPGGDAHKPSAAWMSGFGVVMMVMVILFYGVPTGALIWFLRHDTVRRALGSKVD